MLFVHSLRRDRNSVSNEQGEVRVGDQINSDHVTNREGTSHVVNSSTRVRKETSFCGEVV